MHYFVSGFFWNLLINVLFLNLYIVDNLVVNYMYFKCFLQSYLFTLLEWLNWENFDLTL